MTRLIDRKTFQNILTQLRDVNRDGKTFGVDAHFNIEKDSMGGYTVTNFMSGQQVLKGVPGSRGYLTTFDPKLFSSTPSQ